MSPGAPAPLPRFVSVHGLRTRHATGGEDARLERGRSTSGLGGGGRLGPRGAIRIARNVLLKPEQVCTQGPSHR